MSNFNPYDIFYILGGMFGFVFIIIIFNNFDYVLDLIRKFIFSIFKLICIVMYKDYDSFIASVNIIYDNIKTDLIEEYKLWLRYDKHGQVTDSLWIRFKLPKIYNIIKSSTWYKSRFVFYLDLKEYLIRRIKQDLGEYRIPYGSTMTGRAYEFFCSKELEKEGWETTVTKASNDKGIDIIAKKGDLEVAIQCKNTSKPIGNNVINQVYGSAQYYGLDYKVVISANGFTKSAIDTAKKINVVLIHHSNISILYNLLLHSDELLS